MALHLQVSHIPSIIERLDLYSYVNKRGHIPEEEAPIMMNQVISAVKQWHKSGVIHRDIKDENILVTFDERGNTQLKLIDFGTAAVFEDNIYSNFCVYSPPE